ncbi:MAG: glycoside hydrolase family 43 protein [Bacteroidales bacterium]|nr:glycoside hydrolase family 43 protein [Bacteroidales bacterium]
MNLIKIGDFYYLFGAVNEGDNSRITLARSAEVSGPYLNKRWK